jgi:hypothetical protein
MIGRYGSKFLAGTELPMARLIVPLCQKINGNTVAIAFSHYHAGAGQIPVRA